MAQAVRLAKQAKQQVEEAQLALEEQQKEKEAHRALEVQQKEKDFWNILRAPLAQAKAPHQLRQHLSSICHLRCLRT